MISTVWLRLHEWLDSWRSFGARCRVVYQFLHPCRSLFEERECVLNVAAQSKSRGKRLSMRYTPFFRGDFTGSVSKFSVRPSRRAVRSTYLCVQWRDFRDAELSPMRPVVVVDECRTTRLEIQLALFLTWRISVSIKTLLKHSATMDAERWMS